MLIMVVKSHNNIQTNQPTKLPCLTGEKRSAFVQVEK